MFADKLKELRKQHHITQTEFAKIFHISQGTIGNWESGKREPDYETIKKIAEHFNVTTDYLLGVDENNIIKVRSPEDERTLKLLQESASFSKLMNLASHLDDEELDKILEYTRWRAAELEKEHHK